MEKPNALTYFRGEHRYNCAQGVLKAYASPIGLGDSCLHRFSRFGSGQAPEGECGALFAAKAILQDHTAKQKIEEEFVRAVGSSKCRDIRKGRRFTCEQCVQTAADAVFLRLDDGHVLQRPMECAN
jgi:hypothetical protein